MRAASRALVIIELGAVTGASRGVVAQQSRWRTRIQSRSRSP